MKIKILGIFLTLFVSTAAGFSQKFPVRVILKEGKAIEASHFGQLNCKGSDYFDSYILISGQYNESSTEIKDYSKIAKIEPLDFDEDPVKTGFNEKGKIIVTRKNGVSVTLEQASINLSCYGAGDYKNQIKLQSTNPLTDESMEITIPVKNISQIIFL